jgi:hypothetical protein
MWCRPDEAKWAWYCKADGKRGRAGSTFLNFNTDHDVRYWHQADELDDELDLRFRPFRLPLTAAREVHTRIDLGGLGGKIVLLPWPEA